MTNYTTGRAKMESVEYTPEQKRGLLLIFLISIIVAVFFTGMAVGTRIKQPKTESARDSIRDLHYTEHKEVIK